MNTRLRIAALLTGLAAFAWLPFEDFTSTIPQLLALVAGLLIVLRGSSGMRRRMVVWGLVGGLLTGPIAVLLMLVKTGLHGHGSIPDFSPTEYAQVLGNSLTFALAGALIGAGLDYYRRAG